MSKQYKPHEPEEEVLSVEDAFRDAEHSEARWRAFGQKVPERKIVHSLAEIPEFASEEEERTWWAMHDLAEELGTDVTEEHHALIRRLKAKQCDDLFLTTTEMRGMGESHGCQRMG